jgi:O-antigen/teichoic acid export membrane protein
MSFNPRLQGFKSRLGQVVRNPLAQGSLGVAALLAGSVVFSFVTGVLFARLLGVKDYGVYAYTMAWVGLLVIPANLGLPSLLTRAMAAYQATADWGTLRGLLRWSQRMVVIVASGLALLAGLVAWFIIGKDQHTFLALALALASLPFAALVRLQQSSLRGLHYAVQSQVPDLLVRPLLLILMTLACYALLRQNFNIFWVIGIYTLTTMLVYIFSVLLLRKRLPSELKTAPAQFLVKDWFRSALPFLIISGLYVVTTYIDTLMIGTLGSREEAGIYSVASQGAGLIRLALMAIHTTIAPTITKLYVQKKHEQLQQLLTKSSRALFLLSLPVALVLLGGGHWFLAIFGAEFTAGRTTLIILTLGHLANTTLGLAPLLLSMTEHEQATALGIGAGALLNIALNVLLIPVWGMSGAAIASATGLIIQNIILSRLAQKRLAINPTMF